MQMCSETWDIQPRTLATSAGDSCAKLHVAVCMACTYGCGAEVMSAQSHGSFVDAIGIIILWHGAWTLCNRHAIDSGCAKVGMRTSEKGGQGECMDAHRTQGKVHAWSVWSMRHRS